MNKSEINLKSTIENPIEHQQSKIKHPIIYRQSTIDNKKTPTVSGRGLYHISMIIISFSRLLHL